MTPLIQHLRQPPARPSPIRSSTATHSCGRRLDRLDPVAAQAAPCVTWCRPAGRGFGMDHDFDGVERLATFRNGPLRTYEQCGNNIGSRCSRGFRRYLAGLHTVLRPRPAPPAGRRSTSRHPRHGRIEQKAALTNLAFFLHESGDADLPRADLLPGRQHRPEANPGRQFVQRPERISAREVTTPLRPYIYPPPDVALHPETGREESRSSPSRPRRSRSRSSAAPSWMLTLFDYLKKVTGKTIADVWPTLRLVIHGGALFDPVPPRVPGGHRRMTRSYQDTYPASEGYIAVEDPRYQRLRLIPDHGIFFEFVPVEELDSPNPTRHTLANLEVGANYAVVVTTCAGLWANVVGDTVRFDRRDVPLMKFTGRTKYFLSAFGEHLISEEVEAGISRAAEATGALVVDFHVGPVFPTDPKQPGRHRYLVEFTAARRPGEVHGPAGRGAARAEQGLRRVSRQGRSAWGRPRCWWCGRQVRDWMPPRKVRRTEQVPPWTIAGRSRREIAEFLAPMTLLMQFHRCRQAARGSIVCYDWESSIFGPPAMSLCPQRVAVLVWNILAGGRVAISASPAHGHRRERRLLPGAACYRAKG